MGAEQVRGVYNDQDARSTVRRVDTMLDLFLKGKIDTLHFDAAGHVMGIMEDYHASAPGSLAKPENIAPSYHAPQKKASGWPSKPVKSSRTASDGITTNTCDKMHQYGRLMRFLGTITYEQRETMLCVVVKNHSINTVSKSMIGNDAGKSRDKTLLWLREALEAVDNEWHLSKNVA